MSLAQIMTFGTAKSSTISNERGPGQNSLGKKSGFADWNSWERQGCS